MHPLTEITLLLYLMVMTLLSIAFGDWQLQVGVMLAGIIYAVVGVITHLIAVQNGSEYPWLD